MQQVLGWPLVQRHKLAATRNAPYWSRRLAVDALERWRLTRLRHEATLLVSELVTNSVVALGGLNLADEARAKPIYLKLSSDHHRLLTEVWDPQIAPPVLRSMVPVDEEEGRGLFLVDSYAKEWGFYETAGSGEVVWFMLETADRQGCPASLRA
jgi:anti-sigma regulatory factor (Ser/Thr protein kinase)